MNSLENRTKTVLSLFCSLAEINSRSFLCDLWPPEHQRTPGPDAGPPDGVHLYGWGGQQAADGQPANAAAAGTPEEGGQQPDGGPEVFLVTTETSGQHRVQRRVVLCQRGPMVEEERYGNTLSWSVREPTSGSWSLLHCVKEWKRLIKVGLNESEIKTKTCSSGNKDLI